MTVSIPGELLAPGDGELLAPGDGEPLDPGDGDPAYMPIPVRKLKGTHASTRRTTGTQQLQGCAQCGKLQCATETRILLQGKAVPGQVCQYLSLVSCLSPEKVSR